MSLLAIVLLVWAAAIVVLLVGWKLIRARSQAQALLVTVTPGDEVAENADSVKQSA